MYRDNLGLIVQQNGDGGDTLQRTGFYYLPALIKGDIGALRCYTHESIILWDEKEANFTRHKIQFPKQEQVSRDQLTPNIVALGFLRTGMGDTFLSKIFNNLVNNFFRYPNKRDISSPEHLGQFLRSFMVLKEEYLIFYPFLFLADLFMLLGVIIRCVQAKYKLTFEKWYKPRIVIDRDNVGDDLNTLVSVVQAQYSYATPISWLARKVYLKFRPKPLTNSQSEINNIYMALKWYFRPETGANPEIAVAWKEICSKL